MTVAALWIPSLPTHQDLSHWPPLSGSPGAALPAPLNSSLSHLQRPALLLLLSKWWISEKQQIRFTSVLPWQCHIWVLCLFVPGHLPVTESLESESRWWLWWNRAVSHKAHSEHVQHFSGSVPGLPADSHDPAFCRLKTHKLLKGMEEGQWIPGYLVSR